MRRGRCRAEHFPERIRASKKLLENFCWISEIEVKMLEIVSTTAAATAAAPAPRQTAFSRTVVDRPFLIIRQDFVGFGDFLKLSLGFRLYFGVFVRMPLQRRLLVRLFYFLLSSLLFQAQHGVVVVAVDVVFVIVIVFCIVVVIVTVVVVMVFALLVLFRALLSFDLDVEMLAGFAAASRHDLVLGGGRGLFLFLFLVLVGGEDCFYHR